jgi:hypothetical protein
MYRRNSLTHSLTHLPTAYPLAHHRSFTGKTDRSPNSSRAHALVKFFEGGKQGKSGVQDKLMDVIFRHYFTDGLYPDATNLTAALREALQSSEPEGGEKEAEESTESLVARAVAFMEDPKSQAAVRAEAASYSRGGVSGVPYFFFEGQPGFSGAQPTAALKDAILSVADE